MSWAVRGDLSDTVLSKAICGSLAALCDTTRFWALPVFTHIVVQSRMNGCTDVDIILHLLAHSEGLLCPLKQTSRGRFSRQVRALHFGVCGPFHHVGALAHRGLLSVRGFVRELPLAFPAPHHSAREGCPGHCGTLFYGTDVEHLERYRGQCTARSSEKIPPSVL